MPIRDLLNLIDTYNNVCQNNSNVEFEIQYQPNLSDLEIFAIFKNNILPTYPYYCHNFLRIFDKESNATCIEFVMGEEGKLTKKIYKIHKSNIINAKSGYDSTYYDQNEFGEIKVKLKYENRVDDEKIPEVPDKMRISKRFVFDGFNPLWALHITFIKDLDSPQQIKEWKVKLFDSDDRSDINKLMDKLEVWISNNDIKMELELEHHPNTVSSRNGWPEIDFFKLFYPNNYRIDYLFKLRLMYWRLHPNRVFTAKNKVKTIINQAIETDRNGTLDFWKECIRNNRVQIGEKPDGLRSLLVIERVDETFSAVLLTDTDFNNITFSKEFQDIFKKSGSYIFDMEFMCEDSYSDVDMGSDCDKYIKIIYPLVWESQLIFKKDFRVGTQLMEEHIPEENKVKFVEYNNFYNHSSAASGGAGSAGNDLVNNQYKEVQKEMNDHIDNILKMDNTDGLIVRTGNTYATHKAIKIKPHGKIDFLIKRCPDQLMNKHPYIIDPESGVKQIYLLFMGMNKNRIKSYHLKNIKGYDSIFTNVNKKNYYLPFHFNIIGVEKNIHIWRCPISDMGGDVDYEGKIGEFSYDVKKESWNLIKLRPDKTGFGNDVAPATCIWNNFNDPFTMKEIIKHEFHNNLYKNADLLDDNQIRVITNIIQECKVKNNIIVIGTNYVCCKGVKRSHIMWSKSLGRLPHFITKNVHVFTKHGSKITIDTNLDWEGTKSLTLPADLSTGSFIVVIKTSSVRIDNSSIYTLELHKRYINILEEAGCLITIIDFPENKSKELHEKIIDPNNKLIKKTHEVFPLDNSGGGESMSRHIISWYKRSFSKENIEYQDIGLENPHLSNVYNHEQQENMNSEVNLKKEYCRKINLDIVNVNIHPKTKILRSSLVMNHYKSQLLSIIEFLIKVDNKYVELNKILIDDSIICSDTLRKIFPHYNFVTATDTDTGVDVIITWKNYLDNKEKFKHYNPWYILCTLVVDDKMFDGDTVMSLPRCDKYYITHSDWNNINTCVMHINNFRENNQTFCLRSKTLVKQLIHFQYVLRPSLYKYVISEHFIKSKRFDGCYDCRSENLILTRYLTYAKKNDGITFCNDKTKTPEIIELIDKLELEEKEEKIH